MKYKIIIIILLILTLAFSFLAYAESKKITHMCTDNQNVLKCYDVSDTNKTCYEKRNYKAAKRCWSLWLPIKVSDKNEY